MSNIFVVLLLFHNLEEVLFLRFKCSL